MRIDNLSEEKIRLLRDLIEYQVASYDTTTLRMTGMMDGELEAMR